MTSRCLSVPFTKTPFRLPAYWLGVNLNTLVPSGPLVEVHWYRIGPWWFVFTTTFGGAERAG